LFPLLENRRQRRRRAAIYIRRYQVNDQPAFVLHAADGAALAVQRDAAGATMSAHQQDLEIVSVH